MYQYQKEYQDYYYSLKKTAKQGKIYKSAVNKKGRAGKKTGRINGKKLSKVNSFVIRLIFVLIIITSYYGIMATSNDISLQVKDFTDKYILGNEIDDKRVIEAINSFDGLEFLNAIKEKAMGINIFEDSLR